MNSAITISTTEENYLKTIYQISEKAGKTATTNAIAGGLSTSAASVTDMLKRLSEKGLLHYEKYKGVSLTQSGQKLATALIRKHRLWEVFLVEKLRFSWDEVHEIAEQLEHIKSPELIERLDDHLGFPKFDPHGDPIPDAEGNFAFRQQVLLSTLQKGDAGVLVGVQEHSTAFLQYLDRMNLQLGVQLKVLEHFDYDESLSILLNEEKELVLSHKVCQNLFITKSETT